VDNDERCEHGRGWGEASERWIAISCVWERRANLLSSEKLTKDMRQEKDVKTNVKLLAFYGGPSRRLGWL
jgi:hypothetical protein